jgi:hypothetical protein
LSHRGTPNAFLPESRRPLSLMRPPRRDREVLREPQVHCGVLGRKLRV